MHESTSRICRAYERSDQRIWECACPSCGEHHELRWKDIHWPPDEPEHAYWCCPSCGGVVDDKDRAPFVSGGRWRATRPDVKGHHGYRLNSLISLLPSCAWGKLAVEFLEAKKSPETLQTFVNTVLGEPWRDEGDELDNTSLAARAERFDLEELPPEVLLLTAGADCQDDRIEISFVGWTKTGDALVLEHRVVWGSPLENATWVEVDDLFRKRHVHPNGGLLKLDAAIVDSGDGGHVDAVYAYTKPRTSRRIMAGKGMAGFSRPAIQHSRSRNTPLAIIGVDNLKSQVFNRLSAGTSIRFSDTLDEEWFDQLASERRVVRYTRGQPFRAFERISGKRAEALDCVVYAFAAKHLLNLDLDRRAGELASDRMPEAVPAVVRSKWLGR